MTRIENLFSTTRRIIDRLGPRPAGSEACLRAAEHLKREFEGVCDSSALEEYGQHPGAFHAITWILVLSYTAGSLCLLPPPPLLYLSPLFYMAGLVYFFVQFIFLGTFFDRLFKRRPGRNVIGIVEPAAEPRRRIMLSGHHDSARSCNFLKKHQRLYAFRLVLPLVFHAGGTILASIASALTAAGAAPGLLLAITRIMAAVGLIFVLPLLGYHGRKGTPGAGDNLLSSVMLTEIVKRIHRHSGPLQHTRLMLVSFDGEEIGQKGSQAFVKRHRKELLGLKTHVFNMDSLYRLEDLALLKTDRNGTVRLSEPLTEELKSLAGEMGITIPAKRFPYGGGGTDAGQTARVGIESASLIGISTSFIRENIHYHTDGDVVENIEPEAVEAALNLAVRFILAKDAEPA